MFKLFLVFFALGLLFFAFHAEIAHAQAVHSPVQPPVQAMPPFLGLLIGLVLVIGAAVVARMLKRRK